MLDRILVPVDGSEMFAETLGYIRHLGDASTTRTFMLHVGEADSEQGRSAEASNHPMLKPYLDELGQDGWEVSVAVRQGDPVEAISRHATEVDAELLLMSTHGRSGLEVIREGSVTEQVVRQSPCPVFILHATREDSDRPHHENFFHRMLVPLDGSEVSAAILPCVIQFAQRFNTEVVLFHDHPDCAESADPSRRREFIERYGVEVANAGVSVQLDCTTLLQPIQTILQRTDELGIDLVAMVTHGQGGERRPLDESVTANVMRHASRPLLVWSSDPQCQPVG